MTETNKSYRNGFLVSFAIHSLIAYALLYATEHTQEIERIEEKFVTISLSSFEIPKQVQEIAKAELPPKEEVMKSVIKNSKKMQEQAEIKKVIEAPKHAEAKESIKKNEVLAEIKTPQIIEEVQVENIEQKEELNEKETQDTFAETNFHSIRDKVLANLKYPPIAKKMNQTGMVEVLLLIDIDGKLIEATLHKSSGHALLDKSALSAASKLSAQILPIPQKISRVMLPIYFVLN